MADANPSTSKMVERVARAILPQAWEPIAAKDSVTPEGVRRLGGWMQLQDRAASIEQAKAAIAAMREPTGAMNEAGNTAALSDGAHDCEVPMSDVWRAMCDAALMG